MPLLHRSSSTLVGVPSTGGGCARKAPRPATAAELEQAGALRRARQGRPEAGQQESAPHSPSQGPPHG
eukprot:338423-Alexandrium_andersonii.AAC.1